MCSLLANFKRIFEIPCLPVLQYQLHLLIMTFFNLFLRELQVPIGDGMTICRKLVDTWLNNLLCWCCKLLTNDQCQAQKYQVGTDLIHKCILWVVACHQKLLTTTEGTADAMDVCLHWRTATLAWLFSWMDFKVQLWSLTRGECVSQDGCRLRHVLLCYFVDGPQFWYGACLLEDKPMNRISVTCTQMACTFTCNSVLIHWIFTSSIPKVSLGGITAWMDRRHLNDMFRQVTFVKLLTMCQRNGRHQLSRRAIPNAPSVVLLFSPLMNMWSAEG